MSPLAQKSETQKEISFDELKSYLTQSINMAWAVDGETSYTNSFAIRVCEEGFYFEPRMPAGFLIDNALYEKIYIIANAALYPYYTVLKQNSAYFVPTPNADSIHIARSLFFPWFKGISERLIIPDLKQFARDTEKNKIPIMKNLELKAVQV